MSGAEEEGGAVLGARHRSTMAEQGAGGDGHRGGDGAAQSDPGDDAAEMGGGRGGRESGGGVIPLRR